MKNNLTGLLFTAISISLFFLSINQTINGQTTIDNVNPNANGNVQTIAVQSDGKILVGGEFTAIAGQARNKIARLNADGTIDAAFNPDIDDFVYSIVIQTDGKILVGGNFQKVGGQARNYLVRLNANGTLDTAFNPNFSIGGGVQTVAIQADGKILVGGSFESLGGQTRKSIARLNSNGTLDATFNPGANSSVYSFAIQANGKILVSGTFTNIAGQPRTALARLNADGSLDTTFNPNLPASSAVLSTAIQADGKLVLAGNFNSVGGRPIKHLARLNVDGSVDTTFIPNPDQDVHTMVIQADGKIMVGGYFTNIGGQARTHLARLNADGTLDAAFKQDAGKNDTSAVWSITIQADKIFVGGTFASLGGQTRNNIVQLKSTGTAVQTPNNPALASLDNFTAAAIGGGSVTSIVTQANGGVLISGTFTTVGGQPRSGLARLKSDGTLDTTFDAKVGGLSVDSIAIQGDKILVGGNFVTVGEQQRSGLARLNPDGKLDLTFLDPDVTGAVRAIAIQADGMILIGGSFGWVKGKTRRNFARLKSDGSLDETFIQDAVSITRPDGTSTGSVYSIVKQTDNKILVGGSFVTIGGQPRNRMARLDAQGALDNSFIPGFASPPPGSGTDLSVSKIAIQPDNKILFIGVVVGPNRWGVNILVRSYVARLNSDGSIDRNFFDRVSPNGSNLTSIQVQKDGGILLGGRFDTIGGLPSITASGMLNSTDRQPRYNIARLHSDGKLDSALNLNIDASVGAIAIQADNKILIGGAFSMVNGQGRTRFARLNPVVSTPSVSDSSTNPPANYYKLYESGGWWYSGINLPNTISTRLSGGSAITIEFWFKGVNVQSAVRLQSGQDLIVAGFGAANQKHVISADGGAGGGLKINSQPVDVNIKIPPVNVNNSNWNHIAMTWEQGKPDGFKSYVNGILVDKRNSANAPLPNFNNVTPTVGVYNDKGTLSEFAFGEIGRIRIWKVARSDAEIKESMNRAADYPPNTNLLYQ